MANWYDSSWLYRQKITVLNSQVSGDLNDFPIFVDLSNLDSDFHRFVDPTGRDIRITDSTGTTELPYELVSIDVGTQVGELHFKAPFVSSSVDTEFYIYYGNPSAVAYAVTDTYGRNNVWTNGFVYVNHMQSITGEDSTGNAGPATANNSPTTVSGKLSGNAITFNGTSQYLNHSDFPELAGMDNIGLSAWVNCDDYSVNRYLTSQLVGAGSRSFWVGAHTASGFNFYGCTDGAGTVDSMIRENSATSLVENQWQHIIGWYDFSTGTSTKDFLVYKDGSSWTTDFEAYTNGQPTTTYNSSGDLEIGRLGATYGRHWKGEIDEIRVFDAQRSDSWMIAEYTNQNTPSSFYTFGGQEVVNDWYGTAWPYRVELNVLSGKVLSDLTDFPVYVDLSLFDNHFFNYVQSTGADIRITDANHNEVSLDVVEVDTTNKVGALHFKAPSLSGTSDTLFYIYYGNSGASAYLETDTYGSQAVWSDFLAVWHLGETFSSDSTATDSTGNGRNFTINNTPSNASGKLSGDTLSLNGVNEYLEYNDSSDVFAVQPITVSFWFKPHSVGTSLEDVISKGQSGVDRTKFSWQFAYNRATTDNIRFLVSDSSDISQISTTSNLVNTWELIHGTVNTSNQSELFNNGTSIGTDNTTSSINTNPTVKVLSLGRTSANSNYFDGDVDEIRIRSTVSSSDWIKTEYNNQNDPSTFYALSGPVAQEGWYNEAWGSRVKLTIDQTQVVGDVSDFPVYIDLSNFPTEFFSKVNPIGADIRITTDDGETEVAYELVSIDTSTQVGELHFKAPFLSSNSDTVFYVYYENEQASAYATTDTYGRNNVWSDYVLVSHDGGSTVDSTGNHTMTGNNITSGDTTAPTGVGTTYNGTSSSTNTNANNLNVNNTFTLSAWNKLNAEANSNSMIACGTHIDLVPGYWTWISRTDVRGLSMQIDDAPGGAEWVPSDNNTVITISDGWKYLHMTRTGNVYTSYIDGLEDASSSNSMSNLNTTKDIYIGRLPIGSNYYNGVLSEVRMAQVLRDSNWIQTEFNNQNGSFYTVSTEQQKGWFSTEWSNRFKVIIPASKVSANLTDFPVYYDLSLAPSSFWSEVETDGRDIRVTSGNGETELPFELVFIDTGSETGELHFKATWLSATTDTSFYIYYNNDSAVAHPVDHTYGRNNVWTNGYVYVNHMHSTTGEDSVGNAGTPSIGGTPTTTLGQLSGNAIEFSGTNEHLEHISFSEIGGMGVFGFSFWVNPDTVASSGYILSKASSSNTDRCVWVLIDASVGYYVLISSDGTSSNRGSYNENHATDLVTGSWQHVYSHIDLSTKEVVLHFDDVVQSTTKAENGTGFPSTTRSTSQPMRIAERNDGAQEYDGDLDEIRIFDAARSTDWISTEYANQNDPAQFFTTEQPESVGGDDWFDSAWLCRKLITVAASEVDTNLSDFPVYVPLSELGSDFHTNVKSDGGDIRITLADGVREAPFELVFIDTLTEKGELHFKAPFLSSSTDTEFYIYYCNSAAAAYEVTDTYGRNNVWSDYEAVFHLQEEVNNDSGGYVDSTGNGNDGTGVSMSLEEVDGKLEGNSQHFDGSSDWITTTMNDIDVFTWSVWYYNDVSPVSNAQNMIAIGGSSYELLLIRSASDPVSLDHWSNGASTIPIEHDDLNIPTSTWEHAVSVREGDNISNGLKIYRNGEVGTQTTTTGGSRTPTGTLYIGGRSNNTTQGFNGKIDEVKVYLGVRSDEWISTEYANQNTPSVFLSVGPEESQEVAPQPDSTELKYRTTYFA